MPDWLVQVLIQYPIVVIVGVVAWYAHREYKKQTAELTERQAEAVAKESARTDKLLRELVKAREAEVARLDTLARAELKRLAKALDELTKRLGGE